MGIVLDAVLFFVVFTLALRVGAGESRIKKLEVQLAEIAKLLVEGKEIVK